METTLPQKTQLLEKKYGITKDNAALIIFRLQTMNTSHKSETTQTLLPQQQNSNIMKLSQLLDCINNKTHQDKDKYFASMWADPITTRT